MVSLVPLPAAHRLQKRLFGRFDPAGILRREFGQGVGPHRRMVNVLVGERHVLQHRQKALFAFQSLDRLRNRVEPCQGVQRAAVMTGRHFGGAGHRQGRGRQHGLRGYPRTQLVQCAIQNLRGGRILDKLDQRLDGVGILDTLRHGHDQFLLSAVISASLALLVQLTRRLATHAAPLSTGKAWHTRSSYFSG